MGPRINDPNTAASETLTLRLSAIDRNLLDRLVALRGAELADEGVEVTAASLVRGMIRRDAKAHGLEPLAPPDAPAARSRKPTAKRSAKRRG